ncbi:MAG: 16S rRNA (cytosine(1402)-N(4))-methyltransferase [Anaerolineaceae bacterium]|nr:16S rRNA (cytosine(1402)-N(4))-methyltransferase [Anaerolineaceae bacterium]
MNNTTPTPHQSVLYQEIIDALSPQPDGYYIDATVGAGGHAWGILNAALPGGHLLGLDLDPQALDIASQRLSVFSDRVFLRKRSYQYMREETQQLGWDYVDGIVMDLGVSSMQLDTPERGFSFRFDGPLDMRFGDETGKNAAQLINTISETELAEIIWKYGEDRLSRKIAHRIYENRPINSTKELAELIEKTSPRKANSPHPATRTFQAIRIAVNEELKTIETSIPGAIHLLRPGGHLAIISFHSLEDRLVKTIFRQESTDCICPPKQPICTCGHKASIQLINKKPIEPSEKEKENNPRARSAKLRIAKKLTMA